MGRYQYRPPRFERRLFSSPIEFVSERTKRKQEQKEAQAELEEHLTRCESVARNSRGSEESELEALSAIGILLRNGRLDDSEADTLKTTISGDRFKRLKERAAKGTADTFEQIDQDLALWAAQFAGHDSAKNDSVAQIRLDLSEKVSRENAASVEIQRSSLHIAQDIADLSALSKSKSEAAQQRVSIQKGNLVAAQAANSVLALAATSPIASSAGQLQHTLSMQPDFQNLMMGLQREVSDACTAALRNPGRDRSSAIRCQRAQTALATEPQRVLSIAAQEVIKGLQAIAPAAPQPLPPSQPQPVQQQAGVNSVPYPYTGTLQSAGPRR